MSKTILIVDDEKDIRSALAGILEDEGYQIMTASCGEEAIEIVRQELPDLALLDIWMPGMDGLETLERLKTTFPNLTVIMISGHGTIETAVKATKLGAYDFIEKPLSLDKVLISVHNALYMKELRTENEELKKAVFTGYDLIGESPAIVALREEIARVAVTTAPVLIAGENGTGKVRVGRSIHFSGPRREKPFIAINCASIPEELLESELFGHEKGAFPGAVTQKKGKIEAADGGTLFLNEIGDLSPRSQDRLLEILQEQSFERIGGNRKIKIDIRLIAATKREPAVEVRSGKLREDLFYRLNVLPLKVPVLKDRREDIPDLVRYFSLSFNKREGGTAKKFTQEALQLLMRYEWPGNVRELKNIVERIQIMSTGSVISAADIPLLTPVGELAQVPQRRADDYPLSSTLRQAREEFERDFIISKLEENDWNISRTAEVIELERSNLHRKIKSFGIDVRK